MSDETITVPFVRLLSIASDKESAKNSAQILYPEFVVVNVSDIPGDLLIPSSIYQKEIIGYFCPCDKEHPHDAPQSIRDGKFVFNDK